MLAVIKDYFKLKTMVDSHVKIVHYKCYVQRHVHLYQYLYCNQVHIHFLYPSNYICHMKYLSVENGSQAVLGNGVSLKALFMGYIA